MSGSADAAATGKPLSARFRVELPPREHGNGLRSAAVADRSSLREFEFWYFPVGLRERREDFDALEARVTATIPIFDRRILRTYGLDRMETDAYLRMEGSGGPSLRALGVDEGAKFADPVLTVRWLVSLAAALDETFARYGLSHGAISPSWIRVTPEGVPRLGGFSFASAFADAGAIGSEDVAFLSPQRREKSRPDPADDIFGLAAVAVWALSGGGGGGPSELRLPPEGRTGTIDRLRRSRGIAPIGWKAEWDESIMAGLSASASLRPATSVSLFEPLRKLIPESPIGAFAASRSGPAVSRRLPPWRARDRRGGFGSGLDGAAGQMSLEAVRPELDPGQRKLESEEARKAMEDSARENALLRARLLADLASVAQAAGEAKAKRESLDSAARELAAKRQTVLDQEHALVAREKTATAAEDRLAQKEISVTERERTLEAGRLEVEEKERTLLEQRTELERRARDSAETLELLALRRLELEGIDQELATRRSRLAEELAALEKAREEFARNAQALKTEQERLAPRESEIIRKEGSFEVREETVAARAEEIARGEAELAANRERVAAERVEIARLISENQSIVAEAKTAEERVASARLERTRIQEELRVRSEQLDTAEKTLVEREAAVGGAGTQLRLRETVAARREAILEEVGAGLKATTGEGDVEKWVAALLAERQRIEDHANVLARQEAEIERQRRQLVDAARVGEERSRQEEELQATARRQMEMERSKTEEARQTQMRDLAAWEKEKKQQQDEMALIAADTERETKKLSALAASKAEEFQKKEEELRRKAAPPPPNAPVKWYAVTAIAAAVSLLLGFLLYRSSESLAQLRGTAANPAAKTLLVVVTDPSGAEVTLTGQPPQTSPAKFENLPSGPVEVRVAKNGFRTREQTLEVKAGRTTVSETLVLNPVAPAIGPTGSVYVRTKPTGAEVSIPGFPASPAPALFRNLPAGPMRVSVRLDRYLPIERTVDVKVGDDSVVDLTLVLAPPPKLLGTVTVTAEPADAEIVLGARTPLTSPAVFREMEPGRVKLIVRRSGFEPIEQSVDVRAGESVTVPKVVLKPKPTPTPEKEVPTPTPVVVLNVPRELNLRAGEATLAFVRVEEGSIELSNGRGTPVAVKVTRPFLMAQSEVTQAVYEALMGENPSAMKVKRTRGPDRTTVVDNPTTRFEGGRMISVTEKISKVVPGEEIVTMLPNNPVENVSWEQAMEFCRRLTGAALQQGALPAGTVVRLPTEAEWELAHRGGEDWLSSGGTATLERFGWVGQGAQGNHQTVKTRQANRFGLYDLDGNVAEWCLDSWTVSLPPPNAANPIALDGDRAGRLGKVSPDDYSVRVAADAIGRHVARGGSFRSTVEEVGKQPVRVAQEAIAAEVGFRVVVAAKVREAPLE